MLGKREDTAVVELVAEMVVEQAILEEEAEADCKFCLTKQQLFLEHFLPPVLCKNDDFVQIDKQKRFLY
jgi:hypothetical protein